MGHVKIYSLDELLFLFGTSCFSMSSSNCCFLTCIQISQEVSQVVWYFHLFKNFPQFVGIHTVKGFGIVNKAEIDVFLELSCFFDDPADVGNLIFGSSAFSKSSLIIWKFTVHLLLKPGYPIVRILQSLGRWSSDQLKYGNSVTKESGGEVGGNLDDSMSS